MEKENNTSNHDDWTLNSTNNGTMNKKPSFMGSVTLRHKSESKSGLEGERISKMLRQSKRKGTLKPGDTSDDIHVCILCLFKIPNPEIN